MNISLFGKVRHRLSGDRFIVSSEDNKKQGFMGSIGRMTFCVILTMLMCMVGIGNAFSAGYTRSLTENVLALEGYGIKQLYDFQNNTPAVLPTSGDYRYRDGNIWGLHNFGSGTRSAVVNIPVKEGDILVLQEYDNNNPNTINVGTLNQELSTLTGYRVFDITQTASSITFTVARYGGLVAALKLTTSANITFSKGDNANLVGTAPNSITTLTGSVTIPANTSLYQSDYTLQSWTDGSNVYELGSDYLINTDIVLTPTLRQNTVVRTDAISVVNVTYPNLGWTEENNVSYLVSQATFNGEVQDVYVKVDGKTLAVDAVNGLKLTLPAGVSASDFTVSSGSISAEGQVITYTGSNGVVTFTYGGDAENLNGLVVTYPLTSKPVISTNILKDSYEVKVDDELSLSITTLNMENGTYQWYSNTTASTEGGTSITGANTSSYVVPTSEANNGVVYYYCVATNAYGAVTSKIVKVTVDAAPQIYTDIAQKAYAVNIGATQNMSIAAHNMQVTGSNYQWYSNTTASTEGGTAISGANSASYTIPTDARSTVYYYCVVENAYGKDTSSVSIVHVDDYVTFDFKNWPADDTAIGLESVEKGHSGIVQSANGNIEWPMNPILYPYNMAGYFGQFIQLGITSGTGLQCIGTSSYRPIAIYDTKVGDVIVLKGVNLEATDYCPDATTSLGVDTYSEDRALADIIVNSDNTELTAVITKAGHFVFNLKRNQGSTIESILTLNKFAPTVATDLDGQTYVLERGETKTLTVAGTKNPDSDAELSYQWYRADSDTIRGGTPIEGATSATYVTKENESYYYYCVIRNSETQAACVTTKTTHVHCKPQVSYVNNDADAIGIVPEAEVINIGGTFTIEEKNQLLYKKGYTLTAWTDSTNTYNFGQTYPIVNDIVLYPVFTPNQQSYKDITSNIETTWQLAASNGAPSVNWTDGTDTHPIVVQEDITHEIQDFPALIKTTGFNSAVVDGFASLEDGTTITIPVKNGSVVTVYGQEGTTPTGTVFGDGMSSVRNMTTDGNVLTYTYTAGDLGMLTLTLSAGNYEKITVYSKPSGKPVFTADLSDNYYCETAKTITLKIEATANSDIQWYKNTTKSTTGGTPVSGATTDSLVVTRSEDGSDYYYVKVSNSYDTTLSNCAQVDFYSFTTLDFLNWDATDAAVYAAEQYTRYPGGSYVQKYFYPYGLAGNIAVQDAGDKGVRVENARGFYNFSSGGRYVAVMGMKKGQKITLTSAADVLWLWPDGTKEANGTDVIPNSATYTYTQNEDKTQTDVEVLADGDVYLSLNRYGAIYSIKLPTKYPPVLTKDLAAEGVVEKNEELTLSVEAELAVNLGGHTLGYQWYVNKTNSNKGGTAIAGATSASYTINKVDSAAYYYCLVTNNATGAITPSSPTAVGYYVTVTYNNNGADGETPKAVRVQSGLPVTVPVNQTLYKKGYTLTAWSAGNQTIKVGETFNPTADVTLLPVFTQNEEGISIEGRKEAMTVEWQFAQVNGSAEYDGGVSANVNQVKIQGYDIDLGIKMTDGNNSTDGDYAANGWMAAQNGTFTVPVVRNSVVRINVYNTTGITVGGEALAYSAENGELGNVTYEYTYTGDASELDVNVGTNYIRSITVVYPAPPTIAVDNAALNVVISSDKAQSKSATFTVTGKNLVPGSTVTITKDAKGTDLVVSPMEITVAANGTINQQVLVTYTATGIQAENVSKITITADQYTCDSTKVTFGRTKALGTTTDIVPVSTKTIWNWAESSSEIRPEENTFMSFSDVTLAEGAAWPAGVNIANLAGSGLVFANNANSSFEGGRLMFRTTVAGTVEVEFSNVTSGAARVLAVNGVNTKYTSGNTTHVTTAKIPVEAGDVLLQGRLNGQTDGEEHLRIYKVTFTPDAETPTITVDESTSSFTITTADSQIEEDENPNKETIYYTTDGTEPSSLNGYKYTVGTSVRIATNVTIKAIAVAADKNNSVIAEKTTEMPVYQLNVYMYPGDNGRIELEPEVEGNLYTLNSEVTIRGYAKSGYGLLGWTTSRENIGRNIYYSKEASTSVTIKSTGNDYWAVFSTGVKGTTVYDMSNAVFYRDNGERQDAETEAVLRLAFPVGKDEFKSPITSRSISAPSNYPLHTSIYLSGSAYTLQYWLDKDSLDAGKEKKYELGTNTLYSTANQTVTLVPAYKHNLNETFLEKRKSAFTTKWDFRRAYGAHPFTIPSGESFRFYSTHAKMSFFDKEGNIAQDQVVDIALQLNTEDVEATTEAISNEDMDDWCTMQKGTKITIPSSFGTKITIASYTELNDKSSGGTTVNGESPDNINDEIKLKDEDGAYLYTWTVESNDETAELVIGSDYTYYKYIIVDMPDAEYVYLDYSVNNSGMGTVKDNANATKTELGYAFYNGSSVTLTAKRNQFHELDYWIDGAGNKIFPDGSYELVSGTTGTIDNGTDISGIQYTNATVNANDSTYTLTFVINKSFALQAVFKEKASYYVTFVVGEALNGGRGNALPAQHVEYDQKFVMPDYNYNLYLEGYTLKYYVETDAPDVHYEFGHSYNTDRNMRLVPKFFANERSLTEVKAAEGVTATWRVGNLAELNLVQANGIVVTQVAIDENNTIDVVNDITARYGSAVTADGVCKLAQGVKFTVPTTGNCSVTVNSVTGKAFERGDIYVAGDSVSVGESISVDYKGNEATQEITFVKAAEIKSVSVTYKPLSTEAELSGVKIGEDNLGSTKFEELLANTDVDYDYPAESVYSNNDVLPTVTATVASGKTVITQATVANPTATILLQTEGGVTVKTYTINFNLTGKTTPSLVSVSVNNAVADNGTIAEPQKVSGTISLTFDHAMVATDITCPTLGQTLDATVSGRTLTLSYWNLENNHNYALSIPADVFTDVYGQKCASAINFSFTTKEAESIQQKVFDFVVSHKYTWNAETQTASDTIQILPDDVLAYLAENSIHYGTLEEATNMANAAGGTERFRIFVPNGEYSMKGNAAGRFASVPTTTVGNDWKKVVVGKVGDGLGVLNISAKDYNNEYFTGRTVLNRSNVSIIGQSQDKTIIYNEPVIVGIDNTATVKVSANVQNTYFQDLTLENRFCNYQTGDNPWAGLGKDGGGASAFYDNGLHTICKQVTMKAHEGTYSSTVYNGDDVKNPTSVNKTDNYYEDCELWGSHLFMHDQGQAWWENPTIVMRSRKSTAAIAVAQHYKAEQPWGYVVHGGRVKAENSKAYSQQNGRYNIAAALRNSPAVTFLETTFEVLPRDEGYTTIQGTGHLVRFHEYNSYNSDGVTKLDLTKRSIAGISPASGSDDPLLTEEQAAEYTLHNVLGGGEAYDPSVHTQLISMENCAISNTTDNEGKTQISWSSVEDALCYVVFRLDEETGDTIFYRMVTTNSFSPDEDQAGRKFLVRAANERGGLGAPTSLIVFKPLETYEIEVHQVGPNPEMGWATVCLPQNVTFKDQPGLTVYRAVVLDQATITLGLEKIEGADNMAKGQGYIIYAKPGVYTFSGTYNVTSKGSILGGNPEDHAVSVGTLNIYTLSYKSDINNEVGFYKYTGQTIPSRKAYLESSQLDAAGIHLGEAKMSFVFLDEEEWEADGIDGVLDDSDAEDQLIYDLSGKRIERSQMRKGNVYIMGDKKFIY